MQRTLHSPGAGASAPSDYADRLAALERAEPHLVSLVLAEASPYGESVIDLALVITSLVWQATRDGPNTTGDPLCPDLVTTRFEQTTQLLYNLHDADARFVERALDPGELACPDLAALLEEMLLNFTDANGRVLSDGALGTLFALARTALRLLSEREPETGYGRPCRSRPAAGIQPG
ncbi:MAG: hypothetical protein AAF458_16000 [Pseudomonadota bacterium]